jgi:hypothetical protein
MGTINNRYVLMTIAVMFLSGGFFIRSGYYRIDNYFPKLYDRLICGL